MKKRVLALACGAGFLFSAVGLAPAQSEPPPHPHMLVLGLELDDYGNPVGFRKCVDLAAGKPVPLNAHHAHIHTGSAGEALFNKAGHAAVPGAPLTPWNNCAELIADFFGPSS
ncbi:hypothetical protein [Phytoactinopolyspora limicola]|uniref:hypothetical protein n=1 Tax=Phytoactinopolyspora limicola TaxID=2715536 RepID=UPI00140BD7A6|nr:hypothetical protein [Phytoactinopolyspora limicola]